MIDMKFLAEGRPTLTCMIQARMPERMYELIKKGIDSGTDAFGLQLEVLERKYHTPEIYRNIFKAMGNKPCYVTNYNYNMNDGISDEELAEELVTVAKCGGTLIDIMGDIFDRQPDQITYNETAINKQKALIKKIHSIGKETLISSHTYRFMEYEDVFKILSAHKSRGADVAKIVTAANSEQELKTNFEITAKLSKELGMPYLFLCVGDYCKKHRKIAPLISNDMFLCVAEHDEFSTPAQPLLKDAKEILNLIYQF